MLRTKNIVIHSESDDNLLLIRKLQVTFYSFNNPYEMYDGTIELNKSDPIDIDIDINSEYYHPAQVIGLDNYLDIPVKVPDRLRDGKNVNVISFTLLDDTDTPINIKNTKDNQSGATFYDNLIFIRNLHMSNYYYKIHLDGEISPFPSLDKHAAEIKIVINRLKNILYMISNIFCEMLVMENPVIKSLQINNRQGELAQVTSGMFNGLAEGRPSYNIDHPDDNHVLKLNKIDRQAEIGWDIMPLLALPYSADLGNNGYHIIADTVDNTGKEIICDHVYTDLVFGQTATTIMPLAFTSHYNYLRIILDCLEKFRIYTHEPLLNDDSTLADKEITLIKKYLDVNTIYNHMVRVLQDGVMWITKQPRRKEYYEISYFRNNSRPVKFYVSIATKKNNDVLTQRKLSELAVKFSTNNKVYDKYMVAFDENIFLLNILPQLYNNNNETHARQGEYLAPDSDIVKHLSGSDNNVMNRYFLSMYYFRNLPLYPMIPFRKEEKDVYNYLSYYNGRRLLSKLLFALQGLEFISRGTTQRPSGNSFFKDKLELSLFLYDMIASNEMLHKLERICLFYAIRGEINILNIQYDKTDLLHKYVDIGYISSKIVENYDKIGAEQIVKYYGNYFTSVDLAELVKYIQQAHDPDTLKLTIQHLLKHFPGIDDDIVNKTKEYTQDAFNALPIITLTIN